MSSSSSSEEEEIMMLPKRRNVKTRKATMSAKVVPYVQPIISSESEGSSSEEDEEVFALIRNSRKNAERPVAPAQMWDPAGSSDEKFFANFDAEQIKQKLLEYSPPKEDPLQLSMSGGWIFSEDGCEDSEDDDGPVRHQKVWFSSSLYDQLEKNLDDRWSSHHILLLTEAIEYGEQQPTRRETDRPPRNRGASSTSPALNPQPLHFVASFAQRFPDPRFADWNFALRFVRLHSEQRILFDLLMFMFTASAERFAVSMMRNPKGAIADPRFEHGFSPHPQATQLFTFNKTKSQELQALQALVNSGVPWVSFPLMVIFSFEGARICVESVAPRQPPQLLIECFRDDGVEAAMRSIGVALNISCGPFSFVGPWDMHVRQLGSGCVYLSNVSHLLPGPSEAHRFREECLWRKGVAAASDTSRNEVRRLMNEHDKPMAVFDKEVEAVNSALTEQIAVLKQQVDHSRMYPKIPLKALFHTHGVNMRHLGKVGLLGCVKPLKLNVHVKLLRAVRFPSPLRRERVAAMQSLMGVQPCPPSAREKCTAVEGSQYLQKALARRRYDFICDIAERFGCYNEALPICARLGQLRNTQFLLDQGAQCDDIAELAIEGGIFANLTLINLPPGEELALIAKHGPPERLLTVLERTPATPEALRIAAANGQLVCCQILLGLVLNRTGSQLNHDAAMAAAASGHLQIVEFLMQCQELEDGAMTDLLCSSCAAGSVNVARFLISRGVKVNSEDSQGRRPLEHAVRNNKLDMVDLLLTQKATLVYGDAVPTELIADVLSGKTPLRAKPVKIYSSGPVLMKGPETAPARFAKKTKELLEAANSDSGWNFIKEKHKIKIYRKRAKEGVHSFRGKGVIMRSARDVMRVLWERSSLMKFDPFCQFITVVKTLNESTRLSLREYHTKKCVVGLYRDFLVQDHLVQTESRGFVLVSHSEGVDQKAAPAIPNSMRSTLHYGGWVVEPLKANPKTACEVTYVVRANLKGVPPGVLNRVNISQPLLIHKLRNLLAEPMWRDSLPSFPVACVMCSQCCEDIPKGERVCEVCGYEMKKRKPPPLPAYRKNKSKGGRGKLPMVPPKGPPPRPPPKRNAAMGGALDLSTSGEHTTVDNKSDHQQFLDYLHSSTGM